MNPVSKVHRGPRALSKMKSPPFKPGTVIVAQTPVAAKFAPAVKVCA